MCVVFLVLSHEPAPFWESVTYNWRSWMLGLAGEARTTFSGQGPEVPLLFQRWGLLQTGAWSGSWAYAKHSGRSNPDLYLSQTLPVPTEAWAISKSEPLEVPAGGRWPL